jgi:hypothetical protein
MNPATGFLHRLRLHKAALQLARGDLIATLFEQSIETYLRPVICLLFERLQQSEVTVGLAIVAGRSMLEAS